MRKYILIFAMLTLVLTACRIESNTKLDINDDGSGTLTVEIGLDDEFLALLTSQGGMTEDDFLDSLLNQAGGTASQRTDGDMNYWAVTTEIDDLTNLDAGIDETGFSSFKYSFDDQGAKLTATLAADGGGDTLGEFGLDSSELTDDFISANLIVNMPGHVTEHNADEVRDGALIWKVGFTGPTDVFATSTFGGSSFPWLIVLVVAILAVGIIVAMAALMASRRRAEQQLAAIVAAQAAATSDAEAEAPTADEHDGDGTEEMDDDASHNEEE
jgi:hypothetical protein